MEKITVVQARCRDSIGKSAQVQGWVRTRRDSKGGFSFIELNDGSCQGNLQIVAPRAAQTTRAKSRSCRPVRALRSKAKSRRRRPRDRRPSCTPRRVEVIGWADPETYPLQKKGHTFEFLRTIAHLRPRTNTFGAIARLRNQVCKSIHDFFQEQGFLYVHTPIITASDCEGAGAMFRVTTLDLEKPPQR